MDGSLPVDLGLVIRVIALGAVVFLSLMSGMLLFLASAPRFVARIRSVLEGGREANPLWGLAYLFGLAIVVLALSWAGEPGFLATLVIVAGSIAFALMGLCVVSVEIGRKIGRLHGGREPTELVAFLAGGSVVLLATLTPILGWVLLSYFVTNGLGAVLRVFGADVLRLRSVPGDRTGRRAGATRPGGSWRDEDHG